jgi:hypothetical protein
VPPREFPIVRSFEVPRLGLSFMDRRRARPHEIEVGRAGFRLWTLDGWNKGTAHSSERRECGAVNWQRVEISKRWDEYSQRPGATWEAFEQTGATVLDETCEDPRMLQIQFVALRNGRAVGIANLQNVVELARDRVKVSVRAMPMPGFPPAPGRSIPESWGIFSRFLLENDLELADGMRLSVEEIFLPDDDDSHSRPEHGNGMAEMIGELLTGGDQAEPSKFEGVPKIIRTKRALLEAGTRATR